MLTGPDAGLATVLYPPPSMALAGHGEPEGLGAN